MICEYSIIYNNRELAKEAADEFALEKLDEGYFVEKIPGDDCIFIAYREKKNIGSSVKTFQFRTLKKGDLCWCWDEGQHEIRIFTGRYDAHGSPLFSEYKEMEVSYTFLGYEPTGMNIFDKEQ